MNNKLFVVLALSLLCAFNLQFSTAHAQGSGVTWAAPVPGGSSAPWRSVASSADGTTLYVAGIGIWASTDSGVTWTPRNGSRGWTFVNCSADGTAASTVWSNILRRLDKDRE